MDKERERIVLKLAAAASPAACDTVSGILAEEHRTLRIVVQILQRLLQEIASFGVPPDFALLSSVAYYLDDFPERVHHPKEERHFFAMLRRRTARFDTVIERLRSEHARSAQLVARIERELVHFHGGAAHGLERLAATVEAYAELLAEHMQCEEQLLRDARDELTEDDWRHLAASLGAQRDPAGPESARHEFRVLRARILNALPTKMRLDPEAAREMREPGSAEH